MRRELKNKLSRIEAIINSGRAGRILSNPLGYVRTNFHKRIYQKIINRPIELTAKTFFGEPLWVVLPDGEELYLFGAKVHDAEIRLAEYIIESVEEGDVVFDVGAHFGYFSRLLSKLVGLKGRVYSFEASPRTFQYLKKNVVGKSNIDASNVALSDVSGQLSFYEYPWGLSEYNTLIPEQHAKSEWQVGSPPLKVNIEATTIDDFILQENIVPSFIKIDVEGAELKVLEGMKNLLSNGKCRIALEYIQDSTNTIYKEAINFLSQYDYHAMAIQAGGILAKIVDIDDYMSKSKLNTDNIIFQKT